MGTPSVRHHPLASLGGQQAQAGWVGDGRVGAELFPLLHPLYLIPVAPSFLSAIQTVHTAKQGLKGKGGETVHSGWAQGHLQEGQ